MLNLTVSAIVVAALAISLAKTVDKITKRTEEDREKTTETTQDGQKRKAKPKKDNYIQNRQSNPATGKESAKTAKTNRKTVPKNSKQDKTNKKAVVNMDTGRIFESASEAGKYYGCDSSSILKCCKGKQRKVKGYRWAYENSKKSNRK